MSEESQKAAVYVSWPTFKNAIEQLAQGIPNVIDRSVFPGMAGGVQSQLFAGMRFLGLIDDKSIPMNDLRELAVTEEAARRAKLKEVLKRSYSQLFALDMEKTTPGQALEKMRAAYNVSGDTAGKAMRFFLSAVEYVGIPVSPLFSPTKPNNGNSAGGPIRRKAKKAKSPPDIVPKTPLPGDSGFGVGESRTVKLRSGGTLTISASAGWLSLSSEDRKFVFGLIDELSAYEQQNSADSKD